MHLGVVITRHNSVADSARTGWRAGGPEPPSPIGCNQNSKYKFIKGFPVGGCANVFSVN